MDMDTLKPGQEYKEMKTSHVIFICLADGRYTAEEISQLLDIPVESFTETSEATAALN